MCDLLNILNVLYLIVFLVTSDESYKYQLPFILKLGYQPVFIVCDVEHNPAISYGVGMLEKTDHLIRILEAVLFNRIIPKFQRRPCVRFLLPECS